MLLSGDEVVPDHSYQKPFGPRASRRSTQDAMELRIGGVETDVETDHIIAEFSNPDIWPSGRNEQFVKRGFMSNTVHCNPREQHPRWLGNEDQSVPRERS